MANYRLRVHIRVMNRGQWDILDDLMFSDEVQALIGDVSSYVEGRSLVIDKTVSYNGFLFVNPFYEIIDKIKYNVGECLAIGDYVDQGNRGMAAYVCDIGDFSESETDVSTKLSATSICDMEAWVKARGKSTPQSVISTIKAFYGAEPQPTMQGPWSIEKEIELRHNVFFKADFDEIVEIAKANIARVYQIFGAGEQSNQLFISIVTLAGQIGAAHDRKANSAEKKLYSSFIQGLPDNLLEVLVAGIEEPFDDDKLDAVNKLVDVAPQLCSSILDLSFCFIYVDGKVEAHDKTNLQKLCGIFSMPMSAMYMAMQFGEEIPNPPIDYAAYVSGVDNDTVAYMGDPSGFMNINLGGEIIGVRTVNTNLMSDTNDINKVDSSNSVDNVRGEVEDKAKDLIEDWKQRLEMLNATWQDYLVDRQDVYENSKLTSPDEVIKAIGNIAREQQRLLDQYVILFREIDKKGNQLVKKGLNQDYIDQIYKFLNEVMDTAESVGVNYGGHGTDNGEIATVRVVWGDDAKEILEDWGKKRAKSKSVATKTKKVSQGEESIDDIESCKALINELKHIHRVEVFAKKGKNTLTELISKFEKELEALPVLVSQFANINKELLEIQNRVKSLKNEINELKRELDTLGLFAFKRKKEIESVLPKKEEEVSALSKSENLLVVRKKGYKSVEEIKADIDIFSSQLLLAKEGLNISELLNKKERVISALKKTKAGVALLKDYEALRTLSPGKSLKLGVYRQSGEGGRPIEWLVIEARDGKILVISKYALYVSEYSEVLDNTWENSKIRKWLNSTFYNKAFSEEDRGKILIETVSTDKNFTKDRIFLLSIAEVEQFMKKKDMRLCTPTIYAKSLQKDLYLVEGHCSWWLRTPGDKEKYTACVNYNGDIYARGEYAGYRDVAAIRPAMWIDVNI